ncbi:hypothetical protein [Bacillus sp. Marseille-Q1617]|uniref:hypothetical protein n=1 Tax=Bacillus sp. Marseille-Q1617 TaxID=2736887 RepID=UPI00158CD293|nr:hypothetical protein [Bacillus sp. Marseille-Q1617]
MAIGLIIIGGMIFLLGYITPVSGLYILPISLFMLVYGIGRLIKNKSKNNGTSTPDR